MINYFKKEQYIFPILENGLTPLDKDNRIRTFIRDTNKRLVKIVGELGLTLKMTTYVARHCFETIQKTTLPLSVYFRRVTTHQP